ncbi:uncharacterized protein LOC135143505 [Zophobas morio]|uniref:uncharacterized protein LOC135143505 n=1 Tax=Zophobas morio TaxID=2755281 RepID=UPI003082DC99
MSFTLKSVGANKAKWPILTTLSPGIKLKEVLNFKLSEDSKEGESSIVSETPYFLYKGDYISGSGEKYLVGLVNYQKETVEIEASNLYMLTQEVKQPQAVTLIASDSETDYNSEDLTENPKKSAYKRLNGQKASLIKEFGGKRSKLSLTHSRNDRIDPSNIISPINFENLLDERLQNCNIEDQLSQEAFSHLFPSRNLKASKVEDVYKLDDFLPKELYSSLEPPSKLFLKASSEDLENWACKRLYSPFIIEQVNTLSSLEPDERTQKALILVYLNHLINFSRGTGKAALPGPLLFHFQDRFAQSSFDDRGNIEYHFGSSDKDKIHAHLIVLGLIANKYCLNYESLLKSLSLKTVKLFEIAKVLRLRKNEKKSLLTLSLPITLPLNKKKRMRFAVLQGICLLTAINVLKELLVGSVACPT